jgi:hypothetical protein
MTIKSLLEIGRTIWGPRDEDWASLDLKGHGVSSIIIHLGVILGDICRWRRDKGRPRAQPYGELEKELGNIILSTILWCDDLGFDPELCIERAIKAQKVFAREMRDESAGSRGPSSW